VEEHLCPKPLEKNHKGILEGKSERNLALREENSQSNRRDDYGTLLLAETSSHSRNSRKDGMEEETAHHIVCECPAIKFIRVVLYGKPLVLLGEVMEEALRKIARFASETGLLN